MATTIWVCTQGWSKAECFCRGLGWLATSWEEATVAAKNSELGGFWQLSFVWRFSKWVGFEERQDWASHTMQG